MAPISRRNLNTAIAGIILVAGIFVTTLSTYAADKIKVGALRFTSHAASFVAFERGYFSDEGLEVEFVYFQAAQPMAVAIASGDVDFGVTAISGG